nr:MAG TPA: hypothetical protein [Caudoviricetes sp.]
MNPFNAPPGANSMNAKSSTACTSLLMSYHLINP